MNSTVRTAAVLVLLTSPLARAAFVSIVNLDTWQGGVPTAVDLAGVTVQSVQLARLGVVVELMDGTYESDGTPSANALVAYTVWFGTGPGNPAAVRLRETRGLAINDAGQPWPPPTHGLGWGEWLAYPYETPPPPITQYTQRDSDQPGGGGNTLAGRRIVMLNELVVQGMACQEATYGVVFDIPLCSFVGSRSYLYQPNDAHGHGGPSPDFGGYWIPRNGRGAASAFVIRVVPNPSDCDENGTADGCEYAAGDCNGNAVLDACEDPGSDCDGNGVPDECERRMHDCNGNEVHDTCEIAAGMVEDCDRDGTPDSCQVVNDPDADCDENGLVDVCETAAGMTEDCDRDGTPDSCQLADDPDADCDENGVLDLCEFAPCGPICAIEADRFIDPFVFGQTYHPWIAYFSVSGDNLVMASTSDAYFFAREGGEWLPVTRWEASTQTTLFDLISAVAIEGDTAAIGVRNSNGGDGRVFLLHRGGGGWATEGSLASPDLERSRQFGRTLALNDGNLFVGDPGWEPAGLPGAGTVFVFRLTEQGWSAHDQLTSSPPAAGDHFGAGLAAHGARVVVGATGFDWDCPASEPDCDHGGAVVFDRTAGGWQLQALLGVYSHTSVGGSVAFDGDLLVIGRDLPVFAHLSAPHPIPVYRRIDGQWTFDAELDPPPYGLRNLNTFGIAVAVAGETVLASRVLQGSTQSDTEATYVYRRVPGKPGTWEVDAQLAPIGPAYRSFFGHRIVALGETLFVSAHGATGYGGVYVFDNPLADCDASGHLDICEIDRSFVPDCNDNRVPDGCDVSSGAATDCDHDGVPDLCRYGEGGPPGACCADGACVEVADVCACAALRFVCDAGTNELPECGGACGTACFGDVNGDGAVTAGDRGFVAASIGATGSAHVCQYDLDGNGFINAGDRGFVAANIGLCATLPHFQNGSGLNAAGDGPDARFGVPVFAGPGTSCAATQCP